MKTTKNATKSGEIFELEYKTKQQGLTVLSYPLGYVKLTHQIHHPVGLPTSFRSNPCIERLQGYSPTLKYYSMPVITIKK